MKLSKLKKEYRVFSMLFVIQTKHWFKNPLNIFLGVFISLYTMLCWLAFKNNDPFLLVSGICVAMTRNSMYIYLRTIIDWRNKNFTDKINMTDINNKTKHLSLLAFNLVSTFLICLLLFSISMALFPAQWSYLDNMNGLMMLFGLAICWITCYVIALFLYTFISNSKWAVMIGLLIYFSTMYFLGLGFPFARIVQQKWLNYLLYAHPMRYSINIVQAGFVNAPDFNFIDTSEGTKLSVDFGYGGKGWLAYLLATLTTIGYIICLVLKRVVDWNYKYKSKNKIKRLRAESKQYIKAIIETNDIEFLNRLREDRRQKD
ncbi:ABC transporter permease [Mesoplasma melaleucae]|uniref:ABC transporter permease n=1 Tax=Mesoplasma melaleucae TaxID=81459 RepID=A0A2K8NXJ3_9MOLU|nr:ABC transporter permease [Mesoplasma melaleucae]ATZ17908.1 ABC transporter permease [Mesoplasma melaleucae]